VSWLRRTPLGAARWVVIDCETSGLDMARDRLLSVAAVAVRDGRIALAESYEARVQQAFPSEPGNILIHGIGGDAQLTGRPLGAVMDELQRLIADAILVGFHAAFDATILRRQGVSSLRHDWVDLATLAPALFPERRPRESSLDHWLDQFGIPAHARHDALGDAFATAQLLLVALAEAHRQGVKTIEALRKLQRNARWLGN
jgi:DNA polymerase III subunit epsilon